MSSPATIDGPPGGSYLYPDSSELGPYSIAVVSEDTYVRGVLTGTISGTFVGGTGCTVDPGFNADDYQETSVGFSLSGTSGGYLNGRAGDPEDGEVTYMGWIPAGTTIEASRTQPDFCSIVFEDQTIYYVTGYEFSGDQEILLEAVSPFVVSATPDVVTSGASVSFVLTSEYGLADQRWWFQPGDTGTTPSGPGGGSVSGCPDDTGFCSLSMTESGRMYVTAEVDGLIEPTLASNIVWVRDSIPSTCGTPSEPTPGPGEGPICPSSLSLECSPTALTRGDSN